MGHNLFVRNGKASMMYVGETPWHRLGTKLDRPATAAEAMEAAGLDYQVQKRPLKAVLRGRATAEVPKNFAIVRCDTQDVLSVCGSKYTPIQNSECFSFFDPLVDRREAIYHTAGVLGRGERVWILAQLPDYIRVGKNDPVSKFIMLVNSHDGSTPTIAKLTPIRVVCENTLSVALAGAEQEVRIRHTASAHERLQTAHQLLGLHHRLFADLEKVFNRMALTRISDKELLTYVKTLIPDTEAESSVRVDNIRDAILELHESGRGAEKSRGTVWGAFNAIAEYTDHVQGSRTPDKHLKSMWFQGGERLKRKAYAFAELMVQP